MIPRGRRLPGGGPRLGFLSHELQCRHLGWVWGPGFWPYLCHCDLERVSSLPEPQFPHLGRRVHETEGAFSGPFCPVFQELSEGGEGGACLRRNSFSPGLAVGARWFFLLSPKLVGGWNSGLPWTQVEIESESGVFVCDREP